MIGHKIPTIALLAVSLGVVSFSRPAPSIAATSPDTSVHAAQGAGDEAAIRSRLSGLTAALAKADLKSLSSLWTEDCTYTDEDGNQCQGRPALEKRFTAIFADRGRQLVELAPERIRILSDSVAQVDGLVRRKDSSTTSAPATRFSMLFLKQNGNWLISSANEIPLVAQPSSDYLQDLSWLIGEWSAERDGGSVHMKAEWAANKNFIHCKYEIKKPKEPEQTDIQVIGWDPRSDQLVSWHFDSNGGFGYGNWAKKNQQWLVESTAVEHNGSTARALNVITVNAPNSFSWQSINRSVDNVAVSDTAQLEVKRLVK